MTISMLILSTSLFGQETIFSVMQGSSRLGDQEFDKKEYKKAIEFYKRSVSKDPTNVIVLSKLAQCYYQVRDFRECIQTYDAVRKGRTLNSTELLRYAEAASSLGDYPVAIAYYKKVLEHDPDNERVSKKIWALSNINFLREDSSHYHVTLLDRVNSRASEIGAAVYSDGLVFTSNRKGTRPIDLATDDPAGPYYELYKFDSDVSHFARSLPSDHNIGPVAFYAQKKKMVFVSSSAKTLGLYFAELVDSKWKITSSFNHNSELYSITDVTINEEGDRIYFSSDMKGGTGGKDIYTSTLSGNLWSKPLNLGDNINTPGDEVFPYVHRNGTLYFSSDGLAGVGGLDIFQSTIRKNGFSEPENIGYPINSNADDFSLTFDSLATHGYFSSNRLHGGLDDDIYEFEMDLQTYPFQMTGILKYKEHNWSDTLDIHSWPNVKLALVDTWDNLQVQETTSDTDGNFVLTIPYFSRYHILVTDEKGNQYKASLELEKYRTEGYRYDIVVVKELFAELKDQQQR